MAALAAVPRPKSLYEVEEDVQALLECLETVEPDQEQEFLCALGVALDAAADKRDQVAHWMSHAESQIELSKSEIDRLKRRRDDFQGQLDKLKGYVVRILEQSGRKKLEGHSSSFALRRCPAAVEVLDESKIPLDYRAVSLSLPAALFDRVLDNLTLDLGREILNRVRPEDYSTDKRAVKSALENGEQVDGASLTTRNALVRK